jgi:hypothetical protein
VTAEVRVSSDLPADLDVRVPSGDIDGAPIRPVRMHEVLTMTDAHVEPGERTELHEVRLIGHPVDEDGEPAGQPRAALYSAQPDGMRAGYRSTGDLLPAVLQRRVIGADRLRELLAEARS